MDVRAIPDIKARELLSLIAVREYGSYGAAAAALEVSQPTLSRMMQRLERAIGIPLTERTPDGLVLTPAADELVSLAQPLLDKLQRAARRRGGASGTERAEVRICACPHVMRYYLPKIVGRFRAAFPSTDVHLQPVRSRGALEEVTRGTVDLGVGYVDAAPDVVLRERLWQEHMCVVMRQDDPLARRRTVRLVDLQGLALVLVSRDRLMRRLLDGASFEKEFALEAAVTVPSAMEVLPEVEAGNGAGIVPAAVLPENHSFVVRRLIDPVIPISLELMTLRTRPLTAAGMAFRQMLIDHMRPPRSRALARTRLRNAPQANSKPRVKNR